MFGKSAEIVVARALQYTINGEPFMVDITGSPDAYLGEDVILSNEQTDLTFGHTWYKHGYSNLPIFSDKEFSRLKSGITHAVQAILLKLGIESHGFSLEKYHHFVDDESHFKLVTKTRDLFPQDFNFDCKDIHNKLSERFGVRLGDRDPASGEQQHIILRVNRPWSEDYNPAHKDIYEDFDHRSIVPKMANFWIPISGVNEKSSLPIAEGSHLLSEKAILRTTAGSVINGKPYRVNSIFSWDGRTDLKRSTVGYGSALAFSPHLIHGLALNQQDDQTRVALEFRLFGVE